MAANVQADAVQIVAEARRSRSVWTVLALTSLTFLTLCAALGLGVSSFITTATIPNTANIELLQGTQLSVRRHTTYAPELITKTAVLREGDAASTGADSGAFSTLFDGSTVRAYFSTTLELKSLRTSRFFQNLKQVNIYLEYGTIVFATASLDGYSSADYSITTDQAEIALKSGSKVRVSVEDRNGQRMTNVVVQSGWGTLVSHGKTIELSPGNMAWVLGNNPPTGAIAAEEDLVRNGHFQDPPTSGAETKDNGGLGTAAWVPIRDTPEEAPREPGSASVVTETLASLGSIRALEILRQGADHYSKVGVRQEINRPAEFLDTIELFATVKVLAQTLPVGGPQGNLFPLTISVNYSDADGNQREWNQRFFYVGGEPDPRDPRQVPQGTWWAPQERFVLKSAQDKIGLDVAVINYIEIYGYGRQFQSWITGLSMLAR